VEIGERCRSGSGLPGFGKRCSLTACSLARSAGRRFPRAVPAVPGASARRFAAPTTPALLHRGARVLGVSARARAPRGEIGRARRAGEDLRPVNELAGAIDRAS
jgi:hypothetical protein